MDINPLLSVKKITKSFADVLANDHVDLDLFPGEVLAILGENGAGKSTLMKILYGFYHADSGEIFLEGKQIQIRSPQEARNYGIGLVFQDFVQVPAFNVLENIILFSAGLPFVLNSRDLLPKILRISEKYALKIDPFAPLGKLSVGERQKVELIKLLLAEAKMLIFDEPTRNLAPHEIEGLFQIFANLRSDGFSVVFITHKLKEALHCANRIAVMRRGQITGILSVQESSEEKLISLMFGETISEFPTLPKVPTPMGTEPILELRGIETLAADKAEGLKEINLKVYPGEIVGIAGVSGNGQKELGDVVLGIQKCSRGRKYLFGQEATHWSVAQVRAKGVAFIPEDPLMMASFPWLTIKENMALGNVEKYSRRNGFSIDWETVRVDLEESLARLGFKLPPSFSLVKNLSGGNIQRMILAKELARNPKLIVAFYPTRGLDVRSASRTRELLLLYRNAGAGILLISEDLAELFALCDRLLVLFRGQIVGGGRPQQMNFSEVGYLMTGGK